MNVIKYVPIVSILLMSMLSSCSKEKAPVRTEEEELKANELREPDGIRFVLSWAINDGTDPRSNADLDLELYKGVGTSKAATPTPLIPKSDNLINYSIFTESIMDKQDYTLSIKYGSINKAGTFRLYVEGYTATINSKRFTLPDKAFSTANANTRIDFLKVKRDGTKYTFTAL